MLQCQHCDYTAVHASFLKNHSRKHTGEMLQCEFCDYTTAYPHVLRTHSRKHTDEITAKCEVLE